MIKLKRLVREAVESEDFDAREYFMGKMSALSKRGFEQMQDQAMETWLLDVPPFMLWVYLSHGGEAVNVSVELMTQGERTLLKQWAYPIEELDAAFAQVDRVQPMISNIAGVVGREEVCRVLRRMGKAPCVDESDDVSDFNFADYVDYESQLKRMGFKYVEQGGYYIKSYVISEQPKLYLLVSIYYQTYDTSHTKADIYLTAIDSSKDFSIIKVIKSVPSDDVYIYVNRVTHVAAKLRDIGTTTTQQAVAQCKQERMLESEQEFDAREYFLSNPWLEMIKRSGYRKLGNTDTYAKDLFSDNGTAHYLAISGSHDFLGDPTTVVIEYQKHVALIGFVYPWSTRVDYFKLPALLPALESAIKSASEQDMNETETKAVLDALVK